VTTTDLVIAAFLFTLIQCAVLYFIIKIAFVHGFRSALKLLAGQSRQKGVVKSVQDDFRTVVRLAKSTQNDESDRS
jgi:hypothetical protein